MDQTKYNFDDIEPIPLTPADPNIVLCTILYSEEYKTLMGYLRRLMQDKEYSPRGKYLSDLVIQKVAAHYSVWQYRLHCVLASGNVQELYEELEWSGDVALGNHKNYQVWHYRELIALELMKHANKEDADKFQYSPKLDYPLIEVMLEEDEKNYHVWSHRRWIVETFRLFQNDKELQFTQQKIHQDIRNNSAWNHRFYVMFGNKDLYKDDMSSVTKELEFVKEKINEAPTNPSSWNYLNGIYRLSELANTLDICELESFVMGFTQLGESDNGNRIVSNYAYETLADIKVKQGKLEEAKMIYQVLGGQFDTIRVNYWDYKANQLSCA